VTMRSSQIRKEACKHGAHQVIFAREMLQLTGLRQDDYWLDHTIH